MKITTGRRFEKHIEIETVEFCFHDRWRMRPWFWERKLAGQ
jgi:hypothetical protein